MKKMWFALLFPMLMITCSVLGQDVRYNFDKDTDFSKSQNLQVGGYQRCHAGRRPY